jgi:hypothetical protein
MARIMQVDGRKGNDTKNHTSNSGICIAHLRLKRDNNYKTVLGCLYGHYFQKKNMTTYKQITVLGLSLWPTIAGKKENK